MLLTKAFWRVLWRAGSTVLRAAWAQIESEVNDDELILGFDVRVDPIEASPAWSKQRREIYLLRRDVVQPLSTDRLVWPSVPGVDSQSRSGSWNGLDLWEDSTALESYLEEVGDSSQTPYWIVGITLVTADFNEPEQELWAPRLPLVRPSMPSTVRTFLGYDISDMSLLSGLSNCGYQQPQELQQARERWGRHLNDFHLFTKLAEAVEFKEFTNLRVPEHAPFFVYGLCHLES